MNYAIRISFLAVLNLSSQLICHANSYTYTIMPSHYIAWGINNDGSVVGENENNGHGFLYHNGTYTYMDHPDAVVGNINGRTTIYGINDNGDMVGYFINPRSNTTHGFYYKRGSFSLIDEPNAYAGQTYPRAINNSGVIVGQFNANGGSHGFIYNNGKFSTLNHPKDQLNTAAHGINNNGLVVGQFSYSGVKGYEFDGSNFTTISVPIPGSTNYASTVSNGINDTKLVVGTYSDSLGQHGYTYDGNTFTTINVPDYLTGSSVLDRVDHTLINGINNAGQIVGYFYTSYDHYGFVATPTSGNPQSTTITPLQFSLGTALTISGQGFGTTKGKVLIGKKAAKLVTWGDSTIVIGPPTLKTGNYAVQLLNKKGKVINVNLPNVTVLSPSLVGLSANNVVKGDILTISGSAFGNIKPTVTFILKKKKINLTVLNNFNDTSVRVKIPRIAAGIYQVLLANKAGISNNSLSLQVY